MDAAQVAVSEIVTNALVHAGTPMHSACSSAHPGLRVELGDGSPHLPHRRDYSEVASTGRGLHVVGEVVDSWGAYPSGDGKVVWFEIADRGRVRRRERGLGPGQAAAAGAVEIELLNVPLLMHAAWQEHAAALLRELLLIRLDEDDEAIESHAAASDALNVLFEQIPAPDLGDHPEAIMAAATEPSVSRTRITLRIPATSMVHFEALDSALVEAVAIATDAAAVRATQPEIQTLRHWLCDQILGQRAGAEARPWKSPTDTLPPSTAGELVWDPALVNDSRRAILAADDANQIVAASPSVRRLLGYAAADDLVGNRLISIIPLRFHQAHIAGFTLHLVNGRSPLIGNRVTVPVTRADGSEVELGGADRVGRTPARAAGLHRRVLRVRLSPRRTAPSSASSGFAQPRAVQRPESASRRPARSG